MQPQTGISAGVAQTNVVSMEGDQVGGARGFARDEGWVGRGRTTLSTGVRSGAGSRGATVRVTDALSWSAWAIVRTAERCFFVSTGVWSS